MLKTNLLWKWLFVPFFALSMIWACSDDNELSLKDLKDQELAYLADSIALVDSLKKINAAGVVDYTVTVVSGSKSSIFNGYSDFDDFGGRQKATESILDGVTVTVSQFGKTISKTTDASGMVTFKGFLRGGLSVTLVKEGFTKVTYIAHVSETNKTPNNTRTMIGNLVPMFELTGSHTATITGRLSIQSDLTNTTTEVVPNGTPILAHINASSWNFRDRFLNFDWSLAFNLDYFEDEGENAPYVNAYTASIWNAAYETGIIGSTSNGEYTITVPAAINGLPVSLALSDVTLTQRLFESSNKGINNITEYRTNFGPSFEASEVPGAGGVEVLFVTGSGAQGSAVISDIGAIAKINVTAGGNGYVGTPEVRITGGGGTGATATAVVTNGVVTSINLTSPGTGYTSAPSVAVVAGSGAVASASLASAQTQSIIGVRIVNSGSEYTSAPTVTFSAPVAAGGVQATGTASIANGKVSSITITNAGSGYDGTATVTIAGPGGSGVTATGVVSLSGRSVEEVFVTNGGQDYTYAPMVTFSAPQVPNGTRAQGVAIINAATKEVVGIQITNAGSGYTSAPSVTLTAGSGATAQAIYTGRGVISVNMSNTGANYTAPPTVIFTGGNGQGAQGTAILSEGKVVGVEITNPGNGYTSTPTVSFQAGSGAEAYAVVDNGRITAVNVFKGGFGYTGAPVVKIVPVDDDTSGAGATATATVVGGEVTAVSVTSQGTGYIGGNVPATKEEFPFASLTIDAKPGLKYVRDVHYGTGARQPK